MLDRHRGLRAGPKTRGHVPSGWPKLHSSPCAVARRQPPPRQNAPALQRQPPAPPARQAVRGSPARDCARHGVGGDAAAKGNRLRNAARIRVAHTGSDKRRILAKASDQIRSRKHRRRKDRFLAMYAADLAAVEANYINAFVSRHNGNDHLRLSDIALNLFNKMIYKLPIALGASDKRLRLNAALTNTRTKIKQPN